jgi:4-carboxymuconolactone decarboxylase
MDEDSSRLLKGLATRRKVLGEEYVNRATKGGWDFAKDFQVFITEFCWDGVWNRPGLSHRDRSLICLSLLAALNRSAELETHVKAAINNGLTPEEIRETFIQVTAYCGVPAGVECFRVARKAFADIGVER